MVGSRVGKNPVDAPLRSLQRVEPPAVLFGRRNLLGPPGSPPRPPLPVHAARAAEDEAALPRERVDVPAAQMENVRRDDADRRAEPLLLGEGVEHGEVFVVTVHEKGGPGALLKAAQGEPLFRAGRVAPQKAEVAQDDDQVVPPKPLSQGEIRRPEPIDLEKAVRVACKKNHAHPLLRRLLYRAMC
ncbi:MAG: hypothetical protein BWY99_02900 [Synergistetes bacterium ADurb.BinA166]|nr:MAG: hypothetical protein BWY99_02900 [Synergistetes bacterium ADurb.BinA166]